MVLSVDVAKEPLKPSGYGVMIDNAREESGRDLLDWLAEAVPLGIGEVLVNSIHRDGSKKGYDIDLLRKVSENIFIPVIAMGGVGEWKHFPEGVIKGGCDAVSAGNIFHYTEHSVRSAKEAMLEAGLSVRKAPFVQLTSPRRPRYEPF